MVIFEFERVNEMHVKKKLRTGWRANNRHLKKNVKGKYYADIRQGRAKKIRI